MEGDAEAELGPPLLAGAELGRQHRLQGVIPLQNYSPETLSIIPMLRLSCTYLPSWTSVTVAVKT